MHFIKAVAIVITSRFTRRVINRLVTEAPGFQTGIAVLFIGENQTPDLDRLVEKGLDRFRLPMRQPMKYPLATPLDHTQDRRFLPR